MFVYFVVVILLTSRQNLRFKYKKFRTMQKCRTVAIPAACDCCKRTGGSLRCAEDCRDTYNNARFERACR